MGLINKINKMKIEELKNTFNACNDGYEFALTYDNLLDAWNSCERGDWMLWFAKKLDCPIRELTLAKGLCAKTVIHLMKDQRSIDAVQAAIDFGNDIIDEETLKKYASAAYAAGADFAYAAYAAYVSATAAYVSAAATATASAENSRISNRKLTSDICREILTDFIKSKI